MKDEQGTMSVSAEVQAELAALGEAPVEQGEHKRGVEDLAMVRAMLTQAELGEADALDELARRRIERRVADAVEAEPRSKAALAYVVAVLALASAVVLAFALPRRMGDRDAGASAQQAAALRDAAHRALQGVEAGPGGESQRLRLLLRGLESDADLGDRPEQKETPG